MIEKITKVISLIGGKNRRTALALLILMLAVAVAESFSIALIAPLLVLISGDGSSSAVYKFIPNFLSEFYSGDSEKFALYFLGGFFLLSIVKYLFLAYYSWLQSKFIYSIQVDLSSRLLEKYFYMPYAFHLKTASSNIIRNITIEVDHFSGGTLLPGMVLITESCILVGILTILIIVQPLATICMATLLGLSGFLFLYYFRTRSMRWGSKRQEQEAEKIAWMQQGLQGIKEIKVFGVEKLFIQKFRQALNISAQMGGYQNFIQGLPRLCIEFVILSAMLSMIAYLLIQQKSISFILPLLGLYMAAAFRLIPSANRIMASIQSLRFTDSTINLLHRELSVVDINPEVNNAYAPLSFNVALDLVDVSFKYESSEKFILKNVNLQVKPGDMVGIIGSSGAGKSTLLNIILGLLTPSHGKVIVDNTEISTNLRSWHQLIGYAPQDSFLIKGSIAENIILSRGFDISYFKLNNLAGLTQLEEFISSLPNGFEESINSLGTNLSGGQKQRLSLARALYKNPRILILDEITSALDSKTEDKLISQIANIKKSFTIIVISHRPQILELCNRIYEIKNHELFKVN
jgi:ABC-type multidrug transport system fused ATPase/permease subunit